MHMPKGTVTYPQRYYSCTVTGCWFDGFPLWLTFMCRWTKQKAFRQELHWWSAAGKRLSAENKSLDEDTSYCMFPVNHMRTNLLHELLYYLSCGLVLWYMWCRGHIVVGKEIKNAATNNKALSCLLCMTNPGRLEQKAASLSFSGRVCRVGNLLNNWCC